MTSCSNEVIVMEPSTRSSNHVYVNVNTYLIPPINSKKTRGYQGFQGYLERKTIWSISVDSSTNVLGDFSQAYSRRALKQKKNELLEIKSLNYNNKYDGMWIKFHNQDKDLQRYLIVIDLGPKRLVVKSWIRNQLVEQYEEEIETSLSSIYIAEDGEVSPHEMNPYQVDESDLAFAGIFDEEFVYTKDSRYPTVSADSSAFIISKRVKSVAYNRARPIFFEKFLGTDFKVESRTVLDSTWLRKSVEWTAVNRDGTKFGYGGFVAPDAFTIIRFRASCTSNFEENLVRFRNLRSSIRD